MKKLLVFFIILMSYFSYGQKSDITMSMNELQLNKVLVLKYNECEQERWVLDDSITKLTVDIKTLNDSIAKLNKQVSILKKDVSDARLTRALLIVASVVILILFVFLIMAFNKSAEKELDKY